eukprot:TCALIF_04437-PA protein Name:"Protein of unknown function" AED:0.09 eAED:0.09 QI:0/0.5/0.33/1/0/0.33/3/1635/113
MGDNVQPTTMSSLQVPSAFAPGTPTTSTTPALAGPVMAAGHHQPNHAVASPILYHVTPKLKAAAGGLTLTIQSSKPSRSQTFWPRISMETAAMGGMAGFQYITPNHIIKTPLH